MDNCGNLAKDSASFTALDTTPPALVRPVSDLILEDDGTGNQQELQAWLSTNGGGLVDPGREVSSGQDGGVSWAYELIQSNHVDTCKFVYKYKFTVNYIFIHKANQKNHTLP